MGKIMRQSWRRSAGVSRQYTKLAMVSAAMFAVACGDGGSDATGPSPSTLAPALSAVPGPGITVTNNTWLLRPGMPVALSQLSAASVNNIVYAIGGIDQAGAVQGVVNAYNPTTHVWTARAALPNARADADGATAIGTTIYLPGGRNANGTYTRSLYAYNSTANTWSAKAQIPVAGGCGGSVALGTLLYVGHGCSAPNTPANLFFSYNPATNTWKTLNTPLDFHMNGRLFVANGSIYWMGGETFAGVEGGVERYNVTTNTWTPVGLVTPERAGYADRKSVV